ncbi:MAG: hypothetical protein LKI59_03965 [Bacteroidales bacterium]|jgi:hypothetical protein|nr:hypothetical protein [Bacteroidales bacterium]
MKRYVLKYFLPIVLVLPLFLVSCSSDKDRPSAESEKELVINGLGDDHWTYFSFDKGATVGTSTFLSEEEDKAWAARSDWDFAICGDYIKTNGGTSGDGMGGIIKDTQDNYLNIDTAPADGYTTDSPGNVK